MKALILILALFLSFSSSFATQNTKYTLYTQAKEQIDIQSFKLKGNLIAYKDIKGKKNEISFHQISKIKNQKNDVYYYPVKVNNKPKMMEKIFSHDDLGFFRINEIGYSGQSVTKETKYYLGEKNSVDYVLSTSIFGKGKRKKELIKRMEDNPAIVDQLKDPSLKYKVKNIYPIIEQYFKEKNS
ncbi:hypothetical protein AUTU_49500 (plasmid) [Aureibacter tunicatorum]|nr:hypothetical protein AUTU_49500 [Aureibacter tunicatorum]